MSLGRSRPASDVRSEGASAESWTEALKFWQSEETAAPAVAPRPARPPVPPAGAPAAAASPAQEISPWRNPIRYFSAAMMETPIAVAMHDDTPGQAAAVTAPPARRDRPAASGPPGPTSPEQLLAMAQQAERQGDIRQAREQIQRALQSWPHDVELIRAAARMEDRQDQLPLAESLYRRAVAADPQHAGALNDLGLCLARQGKLEQSVQTIEQAIYLQPEKALYRNNVATVLVELGQQQKALAHLSAVHGPAESNYNLGQLLVQRGRAAEATPYFQVAQRMDPGLLSASTDAAGDERRASEASQVATDRRPSPRMGERQDGPALAPQQAAGEPSFPSAASGPAFNTSSSVPQTGYEANSQAAPWPAEPAPRTAATPRYLPPVESTHTGGIVR